MGEVHKPSGILKARVRNLFQYFRHALKRLERMDETPAAAEYFEQAGYAHLDSVILGCSYLDALSVFRFGELRGGKNFVQFLQTYPAPEYRDYYGKVSSLYLDQPPLDRSGKPKRLKHTTSAAVRKALYGTSTPDVSQDVSIGQAEKRVKHAGLQVVDEELNWFSYGAYFYEWYRCYGVHNVQPPTPDISGQIEPYYVLQGSDKRLVFPRRFILRTLSSAIDNFECEVLGKIDAAEGPDTANDWGWFKEIYGIKSRFFESVLKYRGWGNCGEGEIQVE